MAVDFGDPTAAVANVTKALMVLFQIRIKISKVIPIVKRGDQQYLGNYRPISLLTSFSKILEKKDFILTRLNFKVIFKFLLGLNLVSAKNIQLHTHCCYLLIRLPERLTTCHSQLVFSWTSPRPWTQLIMKY